MKSKVNFDGRDHLYVRTAGAEIIIHFMQSEKNKTK